MYSKYYKKGISENIQDNKYIVVVAHHDDEILWASSICEKASKVIICFSEDEDSKKTSIGRKNFSTNAPGNFYYLNIKEPAQKRSSFIPNKSHIRDCINELSFKKIKNDLQKLIDCPNVYTHNYWGEYGHPQHVVIHLAVRSICKKKKLKFKIFSYFNLRTLVLRNIYLKTNQVNIEKKKVSKKFFYYLRSQYIKNNCWTFPRSYSPPDYEYFYEINQRRGTNFSKKNEIPGIYIFWGQLHYKFNLKHILVKDFKKLFFTLFIDLLLIPPYLLKYILKKIILFK